MSTEHHSGELPGSEQPAARRRPDLSRRSVIRGAAGLAGAGLAASAISGAIAKDPVADSTDVYAFVSPDRPSTVTLIANYVPLQEPAGGPNFYEFGDDVRYEINVDNNGDGQADVTYRFQFQTKLRNTGTFLYNTGPILTLDSPNWNRRQFYTVSKVDVQGNLTQLDTGLACPPCNIGPLSTPSYPALADAAVHQLGGGIKVFAGQRAEGFYVDLGSIFDLANLRPFEQLHNQFGMSVFSGPAPGVNAANRLNVHSIAIQVPITDLVRRGAGGETDPRSVVGVWTTASRQTVRLWDADNGENVNSGPFRQVSRLGNPLINEVIIALGDKDRWNTLPPVGDKQFAHYYASPELAGLLPCSTRACFPTWLRSSSPARRATTWRRFCSPGSRRGSSRASRTALAHCRPTCCGSTPLSRQCLTRTSWEWSAGTLPGSRMGDGYSTAWSPLNCGRSPE